MTRFATVLACAALALIAACAGPRPSALPRGSAAYDVVPPAPASPGAIAARPLQAGDTISVQVYREPDLGVDKAIVDEAGTVQLPLIGEVAAAGRTPAELSGVIAQRFGQRYLKDPQVTVSVLASVPRTVAVEGQVQTPGIFPLSRNDTLLTSLARAGSPTQLAKLNEVVVFRTVNGQRMGAVFDVRQIRVGGAPDPQIVDGDVIVVGYSSLKGAYRDFLMATPLLNLFTVF